MRKVVTAMFVALMSMLGMSSAGAQPLTLPELIDRMVPAPVVPERSGDASPSAALPDGSHLDPALYRAYLPSPSQDPFFDTWPDMAEYQPGRLIEWRDVSQTAVQMTFQPVRALQLKFYSTDALGRPSFGTATVVLPVTPWMGVGQRPVVVNNLPIDSLGVQCTPGYTLAHGLSLSTNATDIVPPTTLLGLSQGYAVLIPDHQGPRMAYAEPYVAGQMILDSIRAVRQLLPGELSGSRFAMTGYSGGAIATHGAVKLIDSYAPELKESIAGAALGGVPADFEMLSNSMDGNLASGLFLAATFGVGRERPQILELLNHLGQQVAISPLKDQCVVGLGAAGILHVSAEVLANVEQALTSEVAREVFAITKMAGVKSGTPLFIYNGAQEFWIPAEGARNLYLEQCALGVDAVYREPFGEHVIAAVTGYPEAIDWLDRRLRGEPAPSEC